MLSAAVFYRHGITVAGIEQAHELLPSFLQVQIPHVGPLAPILFGVALLCAGQSSTLTGTLAGQIVMEGYLHLRVAPWLRRMVTRSIALVPAVITIILTGGDKEGQSTQSLLVLSQVILSLQLAFAVVPLIHFTSDRRNMEPVRHSGLGAGSSRWLSAAVIVALNGKLVLDTVGQMGLGVVAKSGRHLDRPFPASWAAGATLYGVVGAVALLLAWVTLKPFWRPSLPWAGPTSVSLDWADALRPRRLSSIGIALEHTPGDAEILNRALSLAVPGTRRGSSCSTSPTRR